MKEFMLAALPFLLIGVSLAVVFVNMNRKHTYYLEGMCLGMCIGCVVSILFHFNSGLGIGMGMLMGEAMGMSLDKKEDQM